MLKKVVPVVAMCSVLLVGCNMGNNAVPKNNETPMQEVRDDVNHVVPEPNVNAPVPNNGNDAYNNGLNGGKNGVNNGNTGVHGQEDRVNGHDNTVPDVNNGMTPKGNNDHMIDDDVLNKDKNNNK